MPLGLDGMSAQFAADGPHSNQAFTRKLANAKCSVFERAAMCGERAYPCTAALIAEVLSQKKTTSLSLSISGPMVHTAATMASNSKTLIWV
jgi:hypothetical protein